MRVPGVLVGEPRSSGRYAASRIPASWVTTWSGLASPSGSTTAVGCTASIPRPTRARRRRRWRAPRARGTGGRRSRASAHRTEHRERGAVLLAGAPRPRRRRPRSHRAHPHSDGGSGYCSGGPPNTVTTVVRVREEQVSGAHRRVVEVGRDHQTARTRRREALQVNGAMEHRGTSIVFRSGSAIRTVHEFRTDLRRRRSDRRSALPDREPLGRPPRRPCDQRGSDVHPPGGQTLRIVFSSSAADDAHSLVRRSGVVVGCLAPHSKSDRGRRPGWSGRL